MSRPRILIVEDEAVTAADLHDELIAQGYEVTGTAGTAEGALRLAVEGKPAWCSWTSSSRDRATASTRPAPCAARRSR